MAKMNWSRARKFSGYEMKYAPGKVLSSGYVVGGEKSIGEQYLDEIDAKKPDTKDAKPTTTDTRKENWHALQAFVAAAGLKPSEIKDGFNGVIKTAMDIYGLKSSVGVTEAIRAMPKSHRRARCRKYRKENKLMHPKQKGLLAKQKRQVEDDRMKDIINQLTPRS